VVGVIGYRAALMSSASPPPPRGETSVVPNECEAGWAREPMWTFWRRFLTLCRESNHDSLVAQAEALSLYQRRCSGSFEWRREWYFNFSDIRHIENVIHIITSIPSLCFTPVCITPFCFNAHCQFTPLLNSLSLIFGLTSCGWLRCSTLTSYF
jgi:hypothetical protein